MVRNISIDALKRRGWLLALMLLSGCAGPVASPLLEEFDADVVAEAIEVEPVDTPAPTPEGKTETPLLPGASSTPTAEPTPSRVGLDSTEATNPLTGLAVENGDALRCRPILISVANFPPSARPQSGLSFAAQVWETFIGYGMTRFLAVYYGDHLARLAEAAKNPMTERTDDSGFVIGPIRSGRVVYADIKGLFPGAQLIAASASAEVAEQLSNMTSVFGTDPEDVNSAGMDLAQLEKLCGPLVDPAEYSTLTFDPVAPAGGQQAESFQVIYNLYNQIGWDYDPTKGAYLRSQDTADGTGALVPLTDRLTGEQLAFENVVVLWAPHRYETRTIIRINLLYMRSLTGLLFRDGRVYEVKGSTRSGKLRFTDETGNTLPLRPGRTFFEVVSYETTWTPEKGIVRYHNPPAP